MSSTSNPFRRGYQNLGVSREVLIAHGGNCPPIRRRLHPSQIQLTNDQIVMRPCLYGIDIVLISQEDDVPTTWSECMEPGHVIQGIYAIQGYDFDGQRRHIGDVYSPSDAEEFIRRFSFETGFYSRSWEISTVHVTKESLQYLYRLSNSDPSPYLLFEPFKLPGGTGIGIRLTATPWTDENLQRIDTINADDLLQEQRRQGVPEDLLHVLGLAALADIRILVFDEDACHLPGLPRYPTA